MALFRMAVPLAVSRIFTWRPSVGCGLRSTMPISSSAAMVAPIDCGFMPSARARSAVVAAPSVSRRLMTAFCVHDSSCSSEGAAERIRRTNWLMASASSVAAWSGVFRDMVRTE